MKYVMSVNVNVEDGLTNRATGVVKFVEYKIEGSNQIQKVVKHHSQLCEFIMTTLHSYRKVQLQVVVF